MVGDSLPKYFSLNYSLQGEVGVLVTISQECVGILLVWDVSVAQQLHAEAVLGVLDVLVKVTDAIDGVEHAALVLLAPVQGGCIGFDGHGARRLGSSAGAREARAELRSCFLGNPDDLAH